MTRRSCASTPCSPAAAGSSTTRAPTAPPWPPRSPRSTDLGHPPADALLDTYAEAADLISEHDVGSLDESDRAEAAEHAVVSTLLLEPVLLTLRRIAQENASRRRAL